MDEAEKQEAEEVDEKAKAPGHGANVNVIFKNKVLITPIRLYPSKLSLLSTFL